MLTLRRYDDIVALRVVGLLNLAGTPRLHRAVLEALTDLPKAIVIDLAGAAVPAPTALTVLLAIAREASQWPGTRLIVVCPPGTITAEIRSLGLLHRLIVRGTLAEAILAADQGAATVRTELRLDPETRSAAAARRWFHETAHTWQLPAAVVEDASIVLSELVTNAVVHARTEVHVRLSLCSGALRIAVHDRLPASRLPVSPAATAADSGRGLALVGALCRKWGVSTPHLGEGKTVWAVLTTADSSRIAAIFSCSTAACSCASCASW